MKPEKLHQEDDNGRALGAESRVIGCAAIVLVLVACNSRKEVFATEGATRRPATPRTLAATGGKGTADGTNSGVIRFSPVVPNSGCAAAPVEGRTRFAVLGDYGYAGPAEASVAELVKSLQVDFILTTGDNNYPSGAADTIDQNVGQFFREFICPYRGNYGPGSSVNRFFPTLGNHDWYSLAGSTPYREYFTLPGNERYYDFVWGDVHVFAIDSDVNEPDGITSTSVQAMWLKNALSASKATWQVVAMHHPPYSSASHGATPALQWPYKEWGVDLVFAGHDHTYERIDVDGLTYVVTGLGGASLYSFSTEVLGSTVRYRENFGTVVVEATSSELSFRFVNVEGDHIDEFSLAPR